MMASVTETPSQASSLDTANSVKAKKVWTSLITNTAYLSGLLTLDFSLKKNGSKYPLIALYTDTFPPEGHKALEARGIPKKRVKYLLPKVPKDFKSDPRFYDCWSKLTPFSLTDYDRVVQLDSDMVVLQNMDELMDLELDPANMAGKGKRVFAACHACVCNPKKKAHYPKDWVPENCGYTAQHGVPDDAQDKGPPPTAGLSILNGGLQVVNPSAEVYELILEKLATETSTSGYEFADQSLLSDLFPGRWVSIPYVYNALKTLRWKGVHDPIWRDNRIKNIHYILSPKPWEIPGEEAEEVTIKWWWDVNNERLQAERSNGIADDF